MLATEYFKIDYKLHRLQVRVYDCNLRSPFTRLINRTMVLYEISYRRVWPGLHISQFNANVLVVLLSLVNDG